MPVYYAKSVLESKTLWFNVLSTMLVILELQEVTNVIPGGYMPYVAMVIAVCNALLRMDTKRPVAFVGLHETQPVTVSMK